MKQAYLQHICQTAYAAACSAKAAGVSLSEVNGRGIGRAHFLSYPPVTNRGVTIAIVPLITFPKIRTTSKDFDILILLLIFLKSEVTERRLLCPVWILPIGRKDLKHGERNFKSRKLILRSLRLFPKPTIAS